MPIEVAGFLIESRALIRLHVELVGFFDWVAMAAWCSLATCVYCVVLFVDLLTDVELFLLASLEPPVQELLLAALFVLTVLSRGGIDVMCLEVGGSVVVYVLLTLRSN